MWRTRWGRGGAIRKGARLGTMAPLLLAVACGGGTESARPLDASGGAGGSGSGSRSGQSGSGGAGGEESPAIGGAGGSAAGTSAASGTAGGAGEATAGSSPSGGADSVGGDAGSGGLAGSGGRGGSEGYLPRTGPFNLLVYSRVATNGYRHASISDGEEMLTAIGQKQGFNVTIATDDTEITAGGLAKYELVFFLNSTGNIFPLEEQRRAYEEWVTKDGAYAGVHSAAEAAPGWRFYEELIGQHAGPHDSCCFEADVQWTVAGAAHITAKGLPSPWRRAEEWLTFDDYPVWSTKPGFKLLGMVTTPTSGTRPVSYTREWGNFRAFYTSLGHEAATYEDPDFIKHVTAGIMWAVRREALIKE